ncbi:hypothetical protein Pelo_3097 [Pelomyxa schiedti]|nr:hypothetical protein Pelo_3097 [Pelomyxa schiedti]
MGQSSAIQRVEPPPLDVPYQLLRHACEEGDVTKAVEILTSGQAFDPNDDFSGLGRRNFGRGPLACCVRGCKAPCHSLDTCRPWLNHLPSSSSSSSPSESAASGEAKSGGVCPCAQIVGKILEFVPDAEKRDNLLLELDENDRTSLQVACSQSCEMCVESVCEGTLSAMAGISLSDAKKFTPGSVGGGLTLAAAHCGLRHMESSMQKIATFLASKGTTAIAFTYNQALEYGAVSCAKFLASICRLPVNYSSDLVKAAESRNPEMVRWLLDTQCPPLSSVAQLDPTRKALIKAVQTCSTPVAELLIERGADVHIPGLYNQVLSISFYQLSTFTGIIALLQKHGGVDASEMAKILSLAISTRNIEFVESLLKIGASIALEQFCSAALYIPDNLPTVINYLNVPLCPELVNSAVGSNRVGNITSLFAHYKARDPIPPRALSLPATYPHTNMAPHLSRSCLKVYPLQLALHNGASEICLELLANGAIFATQEGYDRSLELDDIILESFLAYLTTRPDQEVVESIIARSEQYSALAVAAELGQLPTVELLISKGVKPSHTSLCCAVHGCHYSSCTTDCKHCVVVDLMMKKGALVTGPFPYTEKCTSAILWGHWKQIAVALLLSRHSRCGGNSHTSVIQEFILQQICVLLKPSI